MTKFIFTFGFGQGHDNGYVAITACNRGEARKKMFAEYGDKWGFQYDSAEDADVENYKLKLVREIK